MVITRVLPDARLTDVTVLTRADDQIVVVMSLAGTLPGGEAFAAPITMVYDLAGGEVVSAPGMYDASRLAILASAFAAAAKDHDITTEDIPARGNGVE